MTRCTPDVVEARAMLDRALVSDDLNDRSNLKALILTELMKERGLGVAAGGRGIDGAPDEGSEK